MMKGLLFGGHTDSDLRCPRSSHDALTDGKTEMLHSSCQIRSNLSVGDRLNLYVHPIIKPKFESGDLSASYRVAFAREQGPKPHLEQLAFANRAASSESEGVNLQ